MFKCNTIKTVLYELLSWTGNLMSDWFFHLNRYLRILLSTRSTIDRWTRCHLYDPIIQEPLWNTQKNISSLADLYVFMQAFFYASFLFLVREDSPSVPVTVVGSWLTAQLRAWSQWCCCRSSVPPSTSLSPQSAFMMLSMWWDKCGVFLEVMKLRRLYFDDMTGLKNSSTLWEMSFQQLDKKVISLFFICFYMKLQPRTS